MAVFEEVKFKWRDREYTVPQGQVLRCIAAVEGTGVTLGQLIVDAGGAQLPLARLSQAVGVALRFAGAPVTDDDVYDALFGDPAKLTAQAIAMAVTLQGLMIPPARMREAAEKIRLAQGEDDPGKKSAGTTSEAASSKSATSASSAQDS